MFDKLKEYYSFKKHPKFDELYTLMTLKYPNNITRQRSEMIKDSLTLWYRNHHGDDDTQSYVCICLFEMPAVPRRKFIFFGERRYLYGIKYFDGSDVTDIEKGWNYFTNTEQASEYFIDIIEELNKDDE